MQDYNSPLAILARDPGIDTAFTGYQVPNTNEYIITCKKGQAYSYFYCINEEVFLKSWKIRDTLNFQEQAPPNIDYSIVTLQDAILEANQSADDTNEQIVANQETNIAANQLQNELLQQLNDRIPHQLDGHLPVTISGPITLNGSTTVSNLPDNQKVTVTNQPTTYPVTGNFYPLTQPVSGQFWQATQPVSGTVSVGNFPTTQAISGIVTISNPTATGVTDSQLRATPLPVTLSFPTSQHVTVDNPVTSTTVTNFPATQAVSLATNTPDVVDRAGRLLGHVTVDNFPTQNTIVTVANPTTTVAISNFPTTQGIAGTVAVSSVPAGLGTSTNQLIANVSLNSIDTKLSTISTAAKQDTGNSSLASIDSKLTNASTAALQSTLNGLVATSSLQTVGNTSLASIDSKLTAPLAVKLTPSSTSGIPGKLVVASTTGTTTTVVKASPGVVYGIVVSNISSSPVYLNMYSKATAPVANDVPVQIYTIPANQTIQLSFPLGSLYTAGISFTLTSNVAILGILTGLLVANQIVVNLEYA